MKKSIKILIIILCMACLTFSLLACDGDGDTTPILPDDDTVVISGEYQPPIDYDDDDVDYSQAVVIEGTTLTGLTEYGKTLKRIVIPDGVTSIDSYAFVFCTSLTSVVIPSSVTSIGDMAFNACTSLASIEIPSSVTSIGSHAFYNCSSLTSIVIPSSVTSMGARAFFQCSSLAIKCEGSKIDALTKDTCVVIINGGENGDDMYYAPIVSNYKNNEIADDGYIYVVADNGIQYALKDGIAKVSGHSYISGDVAIASKISYKGKLYQVTEVDYAALYCAFDLCSIKIPSSVTSIGYYAFYDCSSLTSIEIPSSVTSISTSAFYGCSALTIYCEAESQPRGWDSTWNSDDRPVVWGYTVE